MLKFARSFKFGMQHVMFLVVLFSFNAKGASSSSSSLTRRGVESSESREVSILELHAGFKSRDLYAQKIAMGSLTHSLLNQTFGDDERNARLRLLKEEVGYSELNQYDAFKPLTEAADSGVASFATAVLKKLPSRKKILERIKEDRRSSDCCERCCNVFCCGMQNDSSGTNGAIVICCGYSIVGASIYGVVSASQFLMEYFGS